MSATRQSKRLRILVSAYACEPMRGSEPGVGWNVVRNLAAHHDVWVLTRENNRDAIERMLTRDPGPSPRFTYYDLPRWARFWKRKQRGLQLYYYLWQIGVHRVASRLHRDVGFHVIHHLTFGRYWSPSLLSLLPAAFVWGPLGGGESAPPALRATFRLRGRVYESVRDLARAVGELDPMVRASARRSACILASTEETEARIRRLGGQKVKLLSQMAISHEDLASFEAQAENHGERVRFLSVGRLLHWKGVHLGLHAFARADLDADYWIVGGGPERSHLERLAERLGVADRVRFWGVMPRQDVLRKLRDCTALVHASLHDQAPAVCLEAQAAGRPVICLSLGGPDVQITDATGFRIAAVDPDQVIDGIARAMKRLAVEPALWRRMGQAAREHVRANHLWSAQAERIDHVYQAVCQHET